MLQLSTSISLAMIISSHVHTYQIVSIYNGIMGHKHHIYKLQVCHRVATRQFFPVVDIIFNLS